MAQATTAVAVTIVSLNGFAINDLTIYSARLSASDLTTLGNPKSSTVLTVVPGGNPTYVRSQPDVRVINLTVGALRGTLADVRTIQALFNTSNPSGLVPLVYKDSANVSYVIMVAVEQFYPLNVPGLFWRAVLSAPGNVPTGAVASTGNMAVTASGQTQVINNLGSQTAYPVMTITPTSKMTHGNSQIHRIPVSIANRSPLPWTDQVGDGYPVDVFDNTLNAASLVSGSQLKSLGEDLRIINNGKEINRWLDPATMNANQRCWVNLMAGPMRRVALPSFSSSSVPAAGTEVAVTSSGGTLGWADEGHGIYDNEVIQYRRTPTGFVIVKRGARGSTASAHSAGYFYMVEHSFLTAVHDYTAATDPLPPADRKPMQDLSLSRNNRRVWSSEWINVGDRRSAAWQSRYTEDDDMVQHIRTLKFANGPALYLQDAEPEPSAPRGNNWIMDFPVPMEAGVSLTRNYGIGWNMRLDGWFTDISGNEAKLINSITGSNGAFSGITTILTSPVTRIRLNARYGAIFGALKEDLTEIASGISLPGPSSTTQYSNGFRITIPKDTTYIAGCFCFKNLGATDGVIVVISADDGQTEPDDSKVIALYSIATGLMTSGAFGITQATAPTPVKLKAGDYWFTFYRPIGTPGDIQLGMAGNLNQFNLLPIVSDQLPWTNSMFFRLLSQADDATPDVFIDSQDYIYHTFLQAELDDSTPYTPKIVFGPTQDCYMMNCRVKNETTGDYIDVFYPMLFGEHITIDCANKTVTDSETGLEIGFVLTPSGSNWLNFVPGNNTISYTENGVVATTLAWSYFVTQAAVL